MRIASLRAAPGNGGSPRSARSARREGQCRPRPRSPSCWRRASTRLAPEIVGDLGAVGVRDQPAHLVRLLGDVPVHLAGAVDGMRGTALDLAAMDIGGLDQTDADVAGDAAHRLAPADDTGDCLL